MWKDLQRDILEEFAAIRVVREYGGHELGCVDSWVSERSPSDAFLNGDVDGAVRAARLELNSSAARRAESARPEGAGRRSHNSIIVALHDAGQDREAAAEALGVSMRTVYRRVNELGLPRKSSAAVANLRPRKPLLCPSLILSTLASVGGVQARAAELLGIPKARVSYWAAKREAA